MIVKGRTSAQVMQALAEMLPGSWGPGTTTAKNKLKEDPAKPLVLSGYISVAGCASYRTKTAQTGVLHAWAPCWHFYAELVIKLAKQSMPGMTPVSITLHKHILKSFNAGGKAHVALKKHGLTCAGHAEYSAKGLATDQDKIDASWETPAVPAQPASVKPTGAPITLPALVGTAIEPGQTTKVSDVRSKTRPVYAACTSLYVLEACKHAASRIPAAITSEIPDHLLMRASQAVQWRNRVTRYAEHFANGLARQFFDYLTMAAFGEARYNQGSTYTFDIPGMKSGRSQAYQAALAYDPRDLLPKVAYAFNHYKWGGAYGGKKWGKIADTAALFFKPEFRNYPVVFADHCVDLAHNGGLAFNKGYILANPDSESAYMAMLDSKKTDTFFTQTTYHHPIFPNVWDLYHDGIALGLVPRARKDFKVVPDVDVPSLTWGDAPVTMYHGYGTVSGDFVANDDDSDEESTPTQTEDMPRESYPER